MNSAVVALLLRLCERPHFRFSLRVLQRAKFDRHSTSNSRRLACVLKAREVRAVAPGKRTAQPFAGRKRRIVYGVDQPFVVGRALLVPREVTQIPAGREDRRHAWNRRDSPPGTGRVDVLPRVRITIFQRDARRANEKSVTTILRVGDDPLRAFPFVPRTPFGAGCPA
jgi:hypothetical protein